MFFLSSVRHTAGAAILATGILLLGGCSKNPLAPSSSAEQGFEPAQVDREPSLSSKGTTSATVDPILTRLNGTAGLTRIVLPAAARYAGFSPIHVANVNLVPKANFSIFGVQLPFTRKTDLESIVLQVPISSTSLAAAFKTGNKLETTLALNNLDLAFDVVVRIGFEADLIFIGPLASKLGSYTMHVNVHGVTGALNVVLDRANNGIKVTSVTAFTPKVGTVTLHDSAKLTDLADWIFGTTGQVARLLGMAATPSFTQAVTSVANNLLTSSNAQLKAGLKAVLNDALAAGSKLVSADLPAFGQNLVASLSLKSLSTSGNTATLTWPADLHYAGARRYPNLSYSYLARPAEFSINPPTGDLDVFIPWSLMDKVCFELLQAGWFDPMSMPASSDLPDLSLSLTPSATPRLSPHPTRPGALQAEFALSLSAQGLSATAKARVGLEVMLVNSGVVLKLVDVDLVELNGTITTLFGVMPVNGYETRIESAINSVLASRTTSFRIIDRVAQLMPGASIALQATTMGSKNLRLNLAFVAP